MYLIETRNSASGKLVRQHWKSMKKSESEAMSSAKWMNETFGEFWKHSYRRVTDEEIGFAKRQGWV